MYTLVPEGGDSIVVTFKAVGMLSDGDYDSLNEHMEAVMAGRGFVRVLVDWEELEGWEPGARTVSSWFGRVHHDRMQRMAVVADIRWTDEVKRIQDVLAPTEVRAFPPSKREAALAWLKKE
jgi:hypothetical protein